METAYNWSLLAFHLGVRAPLAAGVEGVTRAKAKALLPRRGPLSCHLKPERERGVGEGGRGAAKVSLRGSSTGTATPPPTRFVDPGSGRSGLDGPGGELTTSGDVATKGEGVGVDE